MEMNDVDFNFLIVCSFRYCLGRMSYAPDYFREILEKNIHKISDNTKNIILKEIKEEASHSRLGMDCDIQTWYKVINILENEK